MLALLRKVRCRLGLHRWLYYGYGEHERKRCALCGEGRTIKRVA